jgi:beta-galactosidase
MQFIIEKNSKTPKMLSMSGRAANGDVYEVNSKFFIKNRKPMLPVMGEFHFSRWNPEEWEEALFKMKAGGIQIAATYVFWIHHEEKQGEWDFTGSRNLRKFLEICKKTEMPVWLRIGPWAHGECRNGGFPDWLAHADFPLREDSEEYLSYVKKYWSKIADQCQGMMCKDGCPIIGIQLENEYGHCCGGPGNSEEGIKHLLTLKKMAKELGMEAPYYTVTAWGGAYVAVGETLPVYGGYVDAPWAQHTKELPASENFLFIPFHNDENIGSDLKNGEEVVESKSEAAAPYLTAELGGGLQVTAHRRTYPYPEDIEAQSLCMLGAGANLLGYYMYHGGFNPEGHYTTLQESKATGYANDLPVKSYDFQTCIRESGELNGSYGKVKKLHLMIKDFEEILAPAEVYLPDKKPSSPEDMDTVRASVRHNHETGEGFLFINNHQRKRNMKAHKNWGCSLVIGNDVVNINNIDIEPDECMVLPYHLNMGDTILHQTNASLLCRLGEYYFFYTDKVPVYEFSKESGKAITLTGWEAERAYKFGDKLLIADCALYEKNGEIYALSKKASEEIIYYGMDGERKTKTISFQHIPANAEFEYIEVVDGAAKDAYKKYRIHIDTKGLEKIHELYLETEYLGDKAEVYHDGKLIADWFTTGDTWHLALKRYGYPSELEIRIYPSVEDVYYDLPVEYGCILKKVTVISEGIDKVVF